MSPTAKKNPFYCFTMEDQALLLVSCSLYFANCSALAETEVLAAPGVCFFFHSLTPARFHGFPPGIRLCGAGFRCCGVCSRTHNNRRL